MKLNNVSLPYPVLGNGDDIVPSLPDDCISVSSPMVTKNDFTFHVILHFDNEDIRELIAQGKAEYACEITCPRTYLRRCVKSDKQYFDITLGRKEVFGRIDFDCYVIVKQPIKGYFNHMFNKDYDGATFDMEPGDILVAFPTATFNASLDYEKLDKAGALMVVMENKNEEDDKTWFDADDDKIIVYLPHDMFEQYQELGNDNEFNEMFHASIVFNALIYALSNYNEDQDKDRLWAQAIQYRIDTEPELQGFELKDQSHAYDLASLLLDDPYKRLFNRIKEQRQ